MIEVKDKDKGIQMAATNDAMIHSQTTQQRIRHQHEYLTKASCKPNDLAMKLA